MFTAGPAEGKQGRSHVLIRRFVPVERKATEYEKPTLARIRALIRNKASGEMAKYGHGVVPFLMQEREKTKDAEIHAAIDAAVRTIRLTWDRNSKNPDWWKGP